MGITAAILAGLGFISAVLGTLSILEIPSQPILSDKLTSGFWMEGAIVLVLLAIVFMLGRRPPSD